MLLAAGALFVPSASAEGDLSYCVYVDENGDIHVSPSGCTEPAREIVYEQCVWVSGNPAVPPGVIYCAPPVPA